MFWNTSQAKKKRVEAKLKVLAMRGEGASAKKISEATSFHTAYISTLVSKYIYEGIESITHSRYVCNMNIRGCIACLDRLFFSTHFDKTMKVGASVVVVRRGGCSATFDELNKYFTITNMSAASSQYWNSVHGREPVQAEQDLASRTLAKNMSFLMKIIALGKEKSGCTRKRSGSQRIL